MMRLIAVRYGMGGCGAHELSLGAAELTVSHHSLRSRPVQPIELECPIR